MGKLYTLSVSELEQVLIVLVAGKNRIKDPIHWVRGSYKIEDKWCAIGSIIEDSCVKTRSFIFAHRELNAAARQLNYKSILDLNDRSPDGHSLVMKAYDLAIQSVRDQIATRSEQCETWNQDLDGTTHQEHQDQEQHMERSPALVGTSTVDE